MYTILCVIELLKAACPSTLPLKINYYITTRCPSTVYRILDTGLRAKALSVCSKLDHSAIQVLRSFPEDECTCMRYTLKPLKEQQPFKYMIAQFLSNVELTLVSERNGLHKHRTKLA